MEKKILAKNRRAHSEYEIIETYEAGIKLTGPEVKSAKSGAIKLSGSYADLSQKDGILRLLGAHISAYKPAYGAQKNYDPERSRILLLNKREIQSLFGKLKEKQLTLVPLSAYIKSGIIKVELGIGRGKKKYEKRSAIKKRDIEREIGRRLKS